MAELTEFQEAAVDRIVSRLSAKRGSRRFLLADEVGLGKTIVAQKTIERLAKQPRRDSGFSVIYLCSNAEIANQNRDRLRIDDETAAEPSRLTLLAMESAAIQQRRREGKPQIHSLTPGTSLKVGNSTGTTAERLLLLYLLKRACRRPTEQQSWRLLFQCGANPKAPDEWLRRTRARRLRHEFARKVASDLRRRFREATAGYRLDFLVSDDRTESLSLLDALDQIGPQAPRPKDRLWRSNRNRIIGGLRACLARVALEHLAPDLIILDEFQRFRDILSDVGKPETLVGKLLEAKTSAVLVLSATPYKMYTQDFDREDHHEDFLRTLAFLMGEAVPRDGDRPNGVRVAAVCELLKQFEQGLRKRTWETKPEDLVRIKAALEAKLGEVMCRTERNWYLDSNDHGILELPRDLAGGEIPDSAELADYLRARRFLLEQEIDDWNVLDFWKSCPSILSFMDQSYNLSRRVRRDRSGGEIPEGLLVRFRNLPHVWHRNLKFRQLFADLFGAGPHRRKRGAVGNVPAWKHLWVAPSYRYYRSSFFGPNEPRKALVFSHWRFVPKAIAILTSLAIDDGLRAKRENKTAAPLRFRRRLGFATFDVCFPSPALADAFSQTALVRELGRIPTELEVTRRGSKAIRKVLETAGIPVVKSGGSPIWQVVARIDARLGNTRQLGQALVAAETSGTGEARDNLRKHLRRFSAWLDDDNDLSISEQNLNNLVRIACFSPAVCLLRSVQGTVVAGEHSPLPHVMRLCLDDLRAFFNRRLARAIVRRWGGNHRSYASRVINYCRDAQFQAVCDEYCYVLSRVSQHADPRELAVHLARGLAMGTGTPTVNYRGRTGRFGRTTKQVSTHFALAFGDEASPEGGAGEGSGRRTDIREAFNSPFWPFVLATTSVGQEGLDFHLYCRDIIHWNLPSNPVDLEQREGRINRRDGQNVRINVARDFPLDRVLAHFPETANPWCGVFDLMNEKRWGPHVFKHGLAPHWLYSPKPNGRKPDAADRELVRRHLFFFAGSKDVERYERLKKSLSLYRLVFGQPRQQDLLDDILKDQKADQVAQLGPTLRRFMLNLSPMPKRHARDLAFRVARQVVEDRKQTKALIKEVRRFLSGDGALSKLRAVRSEIDDLLGVLSASSGGSWRATKNKELAAAALIYLINPFDETFDFLGRVGYEDDARFICEMHAKIHGRSSRSRAD